MDLKEQKRLIRREVLAKRDALPVEQRRLADMAVADRIIGHQWFYGAEVLLAFVNYGSEIGTVEMIEEALRKEKKVFVPRIEKVLNEDSCGSSGYVKRDTMNFYRITSMEQLVAGYKGIPEPDGTTECFDYEKYKECRMLLLMPGVAFDMYGNRMGYGKGFYDRFLSHFDGIAAGIAYSACISEEPVAFEKRYDKNVDIIFSEKGVDIIAGKKKI
jgi:5-formyltetrahydrofolate cyclo-ligase